MQKELTLLPVAVIASCLLFFSACTHKANQSTALRPLPVHVQVLTAAAPVSSSRYVGTVQAVREIPLSMQMGGRVLSVHAKDGDRVKKGQLLLAVDSTQAVNALRSAKATYLQAKDGYERAKQVYDKGAVTDQKMVEIESQYTQARSLYDAARKQLSECTLCAPQDGVLAGMDIQPGQSVVPAVRIGAILDLSAYKVLFAVPETEIGRIALGQQGEMECAAVDAVFPIRVTEKSMKANPVSHTYEVTAKVLGETSGLMPGMVAKCLINNTLAHQPTPTIVVPSRCILLTKNSPTVWVVLNGCAERRAITIGAYHADGVEVTDGLHNGDTLIIDGYQKLYNGCAISILSDH